MPYSADFDFVDYYYGGPAVASSDLADCSYYFDGNCSDCGANSIGVSRLPQCEISQQSKSRNVGVAQRILWVDSSVDLFCYPGFRPESTDGLSSM